MNAADDLFLLIETDGQQASHSAIDAEIVAANLDVNVRVFV